MARLIRGMARTAVVAGTATAVSNRVSRRQAGRWANQAAAQEAQAAAATPPPPPQAPSSPTTDQKLAQLEKLGELRSSGVLTEDEYATQKQQILNA